LLRIYFTFLKIQNLLNASKQKHQGQASLVGIIMGSDSDLRIMQEAAAMIKNLEFRLS
jgi:hypothetical protein